MRVCYTVINMSSFIYTSLLSAQCAVIFLAFTYSDKGYSVCMVIQGRRDVRHHLSFPLSETEITATLFLSILLARSLEARSSLTVSFQWASGCASLALSVT
jgi:hypothetical protein